MIRALVVNPDARGVVVEVNPNRNGDLQGLVGGWLEGVGATIDADWFAFVNEDGRSLGQDVNVVGTALVSALGWPGGDMLRGPVVLVGQDGPEVTNVPDHVLDTAREVGVFITDTREEA